ncbi:MAG TPA: hypothetical protein VFA45_19155, partial [Actinomycetes bacterium]|nr:hypothetical protein [Actinomycetes bacterium]
QHDVRDATGRAGVAFAIANGSIRSQIILDARTFRYLAWQTVAGKDLPAEELKLPPGRNTDGAKGKREFPGATAGSVLDSAVTLAKSVVDNAGERD